MEQKGNKNGDAGEQGQQQQEEHHRHPAPQPQHFYHPHMSHAPPGVYGYPMESGWGPPHGYHPAYGYQYPVQHMEGVPLPPGIPGLGASTDPLEAVLGPFPCVRLRNLPYDTSLEDILVFFQGLVLIDVVIVGQGEAFAVFANPMDFQMALQRNRQTIGRRFVELSGASRSDYYDAVATLHEQERGPKLVSSASAGLSASGGGSAGVIQRRGGSVGDEPQPPGERSATSSVAALWSGAGGEPGTAHSMQDLSASGAGPPTTSFETGMAPQHLPLASAGMIPISGSGAIGVRGGPTPPPGARSSGGLHAPLQKRTGGGIQVGEHTGFLRMRGLPFSASKDDIVKFFEGYNPVPESIVLTYRNDGRATGEAYVGFASPNDSERAMELHRRTMGNRYIELFISNKDEQGRALARFGNR